MLHRYLGMNILFAQARRWCISAHIECDGCWQVWAGRWAAPGGGARLSRGEDVSGASVSTSKWVH